MRCSGFVGQAFTFLPVCPHGFAESETRALPDDDPGIVPNSREKGGTASGRAIVKHIVQAHDGAVRVEGEMGRGTTFFFTLPVA